MLMKSLLVFGTIAAAGFAGQADARPRPEQNSAYEAARAGRIKPLREIESRVLPRMGGARYLGPELHDDRYRLKFMDRGSVIWVDVDPATGAIIGRAD